MKAMKAAVGLTFGLVAIVSFAAPGQQAPAAGRGGRGGQAAPAPRIVSFEARPNKVRAGESVLLVWATENPSGVTIEPEIGPVTARGEKQVTPSATTTYTLALRGGATRTVTVTVEGKAAAPAKAVGGSAGRPDLTGVYNFAGLGATTPPPLQPGAEKYAIIRGPNDVRGRTTLGPDCKPLGVPQSYITPYPFQIIQKDELLVMIFEYPNAIRMIPIDGRPLPVDPDPKWMGNSVGRWEGDTLVVETIGFNGKTEVHGFIPTESLRVVERFKRLENGSLQTDVTVEDPNVFTTPWVLPTRTFALRPELEWVEEFICEGSVDYNRLFK